MAAPIDDPATAIAAPIRALPLAVEAVVSAAAVTVAGSAAAGEPVATKISSASAASIRTPSTATTGGRASQCTAACASHVVRPVSVYAVPVTVAISR